MMNETAPLSTGGDTPRQRNIGLDAIRSCAILFVIAVHFSLNTHFYQADIQGLSLWLQATANQLFRTGVPLFIMLTGYLNAEKTISRKYYRKMVRVLAAYLFFGIITLAYRKWGMHEDLGAFQWMRDILAFKATPYGWYINMWIGLYILTPFLNMLWKAIATKRQHLALLAALWAVTILPATLMGQHLLPDFWQDGYPLAFYFAGCYIRTYRPSVKPAWALGIITTCCLSAPLLTWLYYRAPHELLQITNAPHGLPAALIAVLLFVMLYRWDTRAAVVRLSLTRISLLSLDMYLCAYLVDAVVYPWFVSRWFESQAQFGAFFFVIVALNTVLTLALAQIKEWLFGWVGIERLWR